MRRTSARSADLDADEQVLVVGLGGLGAAIAAALDAHGWQVLGLDPSPEAVESATAMGFAALVGDATDAATLRHTSAAESAAAVVCTGHAVGAGILATHLLSELEVPTIWAAATSSMHGRILRRVGAHRVLYPDADAANHYAGEFTRTTGDALRVAADRLVTTTPPPRALVGSRHARWTLLHRYGVHLLAFVTPTGDVVPADDARRVRADETLVVAADERTIQRLHATAVERA